MPKNTDSRKYTKDHEWVLADGRSAKIGITEYAAHELGDITYVELPEIGDEVKSGDSLAVVESVKAASDVYSPVAGEITAINTEVQDNPAILGESPEGDGWICVISMADPSELDRLMTAEQYNDHIKKIK